MSRSSFAAALGAALLMLLPSTLVAAAPLTPSAHTTAMNDWSCRPTPESGFPRPIVLIHGIVGHTGDWNEQAADLTRRGACVFAADYGTQPSTGNALNGLAPLAQSQAELARFIDLIRARTGSAWVDLVGHSEGGLLALVLAKQFGADAVHTVVLLAPATHGTTVSGLVGVLDRSGIRAPADEILRGTICPACSDLLTGSTYLQQNTGTPLAVDGIGYHVLALSSDLIVSPGGTASFVTEPDVDNQLAETLWPGMSFDHPTLPQRAPVIEWVTRKLHQS